MSTRRAGSGPLGKEAAEFREYPRPPRLGSRRRLADPSIGPLGADAGATDPESE